MSGRGLVSMVGGSVGGWVYNMFCERRGLDWGRHTASHELDSVSGSLGSCRQSSGHWVICASHHCSVRSVRIVV